jgi:hypothetical protein
MLASRSAYFGQSHIHQGVVGGVGDSERLECRTLIYECEIGVLREQSRETDRALIRYLQPRM